MTQSYRPAELGDAQSLSALVQRALGPETLPGWSSDAVRALLSKSPAQALREKIAAASFAHVAIGDGAIVGFILCIQPRSLNLVVVDPAFQRMGIGTQLIERMLQHLASGASDLSIVEVNATEHSLPFYRRLGFYPLSEFIEFDGCRFMRLGYWRKNPICRDERATDRPFATIPEAHMPDVVSPTRIAESLTEHWSPRVIAELDDCFVKVAKVQGSLAWHSHDGEDELFYILQGSLRIEMEERVVVLHEGDLFVVPKGVRHNPVAEHECLILLVERKTTRHTGDEITDKTRSIAEQLRPFV